MARYTATVVQLPTASSVTRSLGVSSSSLCRSPAARHSATRVASPGLGSPVPSSTAPNRVRSRLSGAESASGKRSDGKDSQHSDLLDAHLPLLHQFPQDGLAQPHASQPQHPPHRVPRFAFGLDALQRPVRERGAQRRVVEHHHAPVPQPDPPRGVQFRQQRPGEPAVERRRGDGPLAVPVQPQQREGMDEVKLAVGHGGPSVAFLAPTSPRRARHVNSVPSPAPPPLGGRLPFIGGLPGYHYVG